MHCLLIGNYGAGNLGDELLKEYFLTRFPQIRWTVVSAVPVEAEVPRLPFGLRSLLTTPWWRTLRALRACDAVVFGGGSLFTDVESVKACLLWWWHARWALFFGKPVILAFQGIGPFRTRVGEWCARDAARRAAFASVRDRESAKRIGDWTGMKTVACASCDPVLLLFSGAQRGSELPSILGLIPRENSGEEFFHAAASAVRKEFAEVRIISLQPDSASERRVCEELARRIGPRASVRAVRCAQELADVLGPCRAVVAERYHGALAAIGLGIPVTIVPQREGDKLDALAAVLRSGADRAQLVSSAESGERELRKYFSML